MTNPLKAIKADKLTILSGSLLLIIFLISLTFWLLYSPKQMQRRFLFIRERTGAVAGEIRPVARAHDREREIENYLRELLLGPATLRLASIFPPGTDISQVQLVDGVLYVDFSRELVFNLENHPLTLVEIKEMVVDNLAMNFPRLEKVIITVNGLEPDLEIEE